MPTTGRVLRVFLVNGSARVKLAVVRGAVPAPDADEVNAKSPAIAAGLFQAEDVAVLGGAGIGPGLEVEAHRQLLAPFGAAGGVVGALLAGEVVVFQPFAANAQLEGPPKLRPVWPLYSGLMRRRLPSKRLSRVAPLGSALKVPGRSKSGRASSACARWVCMAE